MTYQCKWCIAYPKDWDGSDPVCLWNEDGTFNTGNWNCGLDRHLWDLGKYVIGEQCTMHIVPNPEPYNEDCDWQWLVVTRYKMRGRVESITVFRNYQPEPATLEDMEVFRL